MSTVYCCVPFPNNSWAGMLYVGLDNPPYLQKLVRNIELFVSTFF